MIQLTFLKIRTSLYMSNYEVYIAGMVHAGMSSSRVVSFLSACYIPQIDSNTSKKKRRKEICASLKDSCQSHVLF